MKKLKEVIFVEDNGLQHIVHVNPEDTQIAATFLFSKYSVYIDSSVDPIFNSKDQVFVFMSSADKDACQRIENAIKKELE